MLAGRLTKRHSYLEGPERGATQSEGEDVAIRTSRVKVVDRDTALELLSQLRDFLESCAEEVNDRAVSIPSQQVLPNTSERAMMEDDEWYDALPDEE